MMLDYDFMQTAFAASGLVALVAGVVGYFVVLRRQAFAGHALSHVGFAGATGAALLGWNPMTGLVLVTLLAATWMGSLADRLERSDVATAAVLSLSLGFGMLFLHFYTSYATEATALLFGNVLAVDVQTLGLLAAIGAICLAVLALIARPLLFASLQPELAEAKGVPMRGISMLFLGVVALCTAECIQIVGVLLVFTLMVGPAATVQQLSTSIKRGVILSALLALLEAWGGLTLAYYTDWPTSFWITALSSSAYLLGALFVRWQGRQAAPSTHLHSHDHDHDHGHDHRH